MKVEDMIVVSDLDGTLVPVSQQISSRNILAVRRFRELGGTFTIATGRSPAAAKRFLSVLDVQTPIIANNGAVIYDVSRESPLWWRCLDPSFRKVVADVKETFPEVGIEVIDARDGYHLVADLPRSIVIVSGFQYVRDTPESLPDDCCKVLFAMEPEAFDRVVAGIQSHGYQGFEFVQSGGDCYEMMADGVNKGLPLEELARIHGQSLASVVAVGDYYNDVELLTKARFSAAMGNAPAAIQAKADIVLPTCEEDGVAALLEYLIQNHDSL